MIRGEGWFAARAMTIPSWSIGRGTTVAANKTKNASGLLKSWIFDPGDITRVEQDQGADQHRLLHRGYDDNLICMTARTSRIAQVSGDRFAQFFVTVIGSVSQ